MAQTEIITRWKQIRAQSFRYPTGPASGIGDAISKISFFYLEVPPQEFKAKGILYELLEEGTVSAPGQITDPIGALYHSALSRKEVQKILVLKPNAIAYAYSHFAPVVEERDNPSGFVELIFDRYFLAEESPQNALNFQVT